MSVFRVTRDTATVIKSKKNRSTKLTKENILNNEYKISLNDDELDEKITSDKLTCPICLEIFKRPIILSCR
jgi:hypothetical protein